MAQGIGPDLLVIDGPGESHYEDAPDGACNICEGVAPKGRKHPCRFDARSLCSCWRGRPCGKAAKP